MKIIKHSKKHLIEIGNTEAENIRKRIKELGINNKTLLELYNIT